MRVADFGLARALAEASWTEPAGTVLGTARYAAPEQAPGAALDGRADIYALGCVLFEMLSGMVPHGDRGSDRVLVRRITDPAPSLAAFCPVPVAVDDALIRALAPSAEDRFDTTGDFVAALERPDASEAAAVRSAGRL